MNVLYACMNERVITYGSWIALLVALLSVFGVSFFGWTIVRDESERIINVQSAQEYAIKKDVAVRTQALAVDTKDARDRLDELMDVEIISAVDILESAAKAARVGMELGSAQPENAPAGAEGVKAVGFYVSATGSYVAVTRALMLFETLPLPSSVERFDIERASGAGGATSWRLNAHIRVLTTASISS